MAQKPSIPKGTRDFSPQEMVRRNYIFDTIRSVYQRYGFLPIETPAMENIETLTGKYGDEGDQLIFKILNSRQYEAKNKEELKAEYAKSLERNINSNLLTEKALRYDLTVPFARYVVMHQHEITFPFKRYQVQPVWRGDRPAKGRYREFYQCDADVIGSDSLINEVELVQIIDDVFTQLGLPVVIKINNRKILSGIADYCGCPNKLVDITVAIDKVEKIGIDGVKQELLEHGISEEKVNAIFECIFPEESMLRFFSAEELINDYGYTKEEAEEDVLLQNSKYRRSLDILHCLLENFSYEDSKSEKGILGVSEVITVFNYINDLELKTARLEFDPTLARGLNYYTGAIFEVKVDNTRCASGFTSSILGGGRYDDLTGIFGLKGVSGVGISFGADRIYDVLEELNLYPASVAASTKVMFVNFGTEEEKYCLRLLATIRAKGISAELYPEQAKMKKQMGYADAKKIPFVVLVGSDEMSSGQLTLKNMQSGEQEKISIEELINKLK